MGNPWIEGNRAIRPGLDVDILGMQEPVNGRLLHALQRPAEQPAQAQCLPVGKGLVPFSPLPNDLSERFPPGVFFNEEEQILYFAGGEKVQQERAGKPPQLLCLKLHLRTGLREIPEHGPGKSTKIHGLVFHQIIGLRQAEDLLVAHNVENLVSSQYTLAEAQMGIEGDRRQRRLPPGMRCTANLFYIIEYIL